ncbi:MAG: pseudaminic acid cytidylyltransferase [Christiangramia sp.]
MPGNICIIPARGGSKRIPRKNIKEFLGKPILAYSIEAAIATGIFDRIIVSTDDLEISKIAEKYGAEVPFLRTEENSNDYATTMDVIKEVCGQLNQQEEVYDIICCLYPCAPFVKANKLVEAFDLMNSSGFESVLPIIAFSYPIQRALKVNNGKVDFLNPKYLTARSQDLDKSYHDSGQFYFFKSAVLQNGNLFTNNTGCIIIDEKEGQDIDTLDDWTLAEIKYEYLQSFKAE